jgi:hypothetical protein
VPTTTTTTVNADKIIQSLSTNLSTYNAANTDDWVKITSAEYALLKTNVSGTSVAGITDTYMSDALSSLITTTDQSVIVYNSAVIPSAPAIPANTYLYAFAVKYGQTTPATDARVFTNTNTASNTGFNQVGNILPATTTDGSGLAISYYVRKGVSSVNGGTDGLLSVFTGQTANSAIPLAFLAPIASSYRMNYLFFTPGASGGIPNSSSVISSQSSSAAFAIQGLTTATKQWA